MVLEADYPQDNARSTVLLAVAKENNLDIELVETRPPNVSQDYLKLNPLGRIPTFVGSNGFILTESIAIAIYCTFLESYPALSSLRPKMSHIITYSYPCLNICVDYP